MKSGVLVVAAAAVVAAAVLAGCAAAQQVNGTTPACASKLLPCGQYLNGTGTPPESCCGPLKEAVTQDMACLCAIFTSPEILKAFNIDVSLALRLPNRCHFSSDPDACSKSAAGPPSSTNPQATPDANNSAGGRGVTLLGVSLFLVWWSVVA